MKNIPDVVVFAAIHGAHPAGQRFALFNNIPDVVVFAAIHGAHPEGQRFALFNNIPDVFCIRCHPWRSPCGPTLCVVQQHSRCFLYSLPSVALTDLFSLSAVISLSSVTHKLLLLSHCAVLSHFSI
ncbi:hypothetical protein [Rheinheimera mangrovi]|uniref:hypothetical protein n=1 Tax=Rheinheimera mangrovi TaxID=2498451 RepID=UPI000F8E7C7B|nr:hypothetical protein [Rheinheimera mangrovi]